MPPPFWGALCDGLHLPEALRRQWWEGLCCSRWSEAYAFKQRLFTPGAQRSTPAHMVKVLENLAKEGRLTHDTSNRIMSYVLARTNRAGEWIVRDTP
jgi:hypothetical protein